MGIRNQSTWLFRSAVVMAAALTVSAAAAADFPTKKAPLPAPVVTPAPVVGSVLSGFFVRAGFLYAINQSTSKLYAQPAPIPGLAEQQLIGVGANISNVATLGVEAGYFVMPNVSIDVSAGFPMWATNKTKGSPGSPFIFPYPPGYPLPPSGTLLGKFMPSFIPITVNYHFSQFGAFQPYLGVGVAAVFAFRTKDEFETGNHVDPTIGLVLQAGADVMIDQHWGWNLDVKKLFADGEAKSTGVNLAQLGLPYTLGGNTAATTATQKTRFEPWVLATGITYRW
jgi:outer membrane protein